MVLVDLVLQAVLAAATVVVVVELVEALAVVAAALVFPVVMGILDDQVEAMVMEGELVFQTLILMSPVYLQQLVRVAMEQELVMELEMESEVEVLRVRVLQSNRVE